MKNILSFIVIISMGLLVACGGSNTSSENARSASETSETGATLTTNFESGESTTGELRIEYTITSANGETLAGTIHWGDNTTSRISGTGEAAHQYRGTGTVSVNVQLDDGSLFRLGQLRITGSSGAGNGNERIVTFRESFNRSANNGFSSNLPVQRLVYDLSDVVPTTDAQFTVESISADLSFFTEFLILRINGRAIEGFGNTGGSDCRLINRPSELNFTIPLADLIAERNSNSGKVIIEFIPTQAVGDFCNGSSFGGSTSRATATLTFTGR